MPLYSRKDFAEACGTDPAVIRVNIQRGKIVPSGKFIDDSIPQNRDFLLHWQEKSRDKAEQIKIESAQESESEPYANGDSKPSSKVSGYEHPRFAKQKDPGVTSPDQQRSSLQQIKTAHEIDKLKIETELKHLQKEKLEGIVIPTELVKMVIIQQRKADIAAFRNACDNILTEFASKHKMSNEESSRIRGRITEITNKAIDESEKIALKEISRIVDEYADTRGKGERKN